MRSLIIAWLAIGVLANEACHAQEVLNMAWEAPPGIVDARTIESLPGENGRGRLVRDFDGNGVDDMALVREDSEGHIIGILVALFRNDGTVRTRLIEDVPSRLGLSDRAKLWGFGHVSGEGTDLLFEEDGSVKMFNYRDGPQPEVNSIWQMPGSFSFARILAVADFTGDDFDDLLLEVEEGQSGSPRVQLWTGSFPIDGGAAIAR